MRGSTSGVSLLLSWATAPFAAASRRQSAGQSRAVRIKLPIRRRRDQWVGSRVDSPVPLFADRKWSSDDIKYFRGGLYAQLSRSDVSKLFPGYDNIKASRRIPVCQLLARCAAAKRSELNRQQRRCQPGGNRRPIVVRKVLHTLRSTGPGTSAACGGMLMVGRLSKPPEICRMSPCRFVARA
jgi:hypothetical protein